MLNKEDLKEIVNIGIALSIEKDRNRMLEMILWGAMKISKCDAGTLYLKNGDQLDFKIMKTLSQNVSKGQNGEFIALPPVKMLEENVCAYSAIHREVVNIKDVYCSERFDFKGPKKYDAITGYRTKSMLVFPMEATDGEIVGVIQLMNAMDEAGEITVFTAEDEFVLRFLGSLGAISITNMKYADEIKEQMYSFADAFATAVDERTPYNGSHTKKVTAYVSMFSHYINHLHENGLCDEYFDENRSGQLKLAAALHDIGKMIVPKAVMNKESRLDKELEKVEWRFKLLSAYYEIDSLKGRISKEEYLTEQEYLQESLEFIKEANVAGFLSDDKIKRIYDIAEKVYITEQGEEILYLTEYEKECLLVRKGTLTQKEREIMESHVVMTGKILNKVQFHSFHERVPEIATSHHEYLDGTGYPNRLTAKQLPTESRILTIVDIYDALTSADRPYKKAMSNEQAFSILYSMADEGKLDKKLITWFKEAIEFLDKEE